MTTPTLPLMAFFGGTFDPIHYGHLRPLEQLAKEIALQQIILLPNHVPPHRPQPQASAQQRLEMVRLAVANHPHWRVDDRELQVVRPSYTIDTLNALRNEYGPQQPLAFIIGQDSLLNLSSWHRWQELLAVSHLIVLARPGYQQPLPEHLQQWLQGHQTFSAAALTATPCGNIYLADTALWDIAATTLRQRFKQGLSCHDLLPEPVECYIKTQGLYRR
jgi:nicotinate-nucleotide adenylyltransferase